MHQTSQHTIICWWYMFNIGKKEYWYFGKDGWPGN